MRSVAPRSAQRTSLLLRRENGAAHEARKVGTILQKSLDPVERRLDLLDLVFLQCEVEQSDRIAPCHSRHKSFFASHFSVLSFLALRAEASLGLLRSQKGSQERFALGSSEVLELPFL